MSERQATARRAALVGAWVAAAALWLCPAAEGAVAAEGSCANEAIRSEQVSSYLPNCRAYEQVTPVAKDSGEPQNGEEDLFEPTRGALVAFDGQRMAWITEFPGLAPPASIGLEYLSTRGPDGWLTEATVPPQSRQTGLACAENPGIVGWSRNLARGVLADGAAQEFGSSGGSAPETFANQSFGCGHAEPALSEADGAEIKEPAGFQNLFLRNNETGSYQIVNFTPAGEPTPTPREEDQVYFAPNFLAGSASLQDIAFEDELPLTREAEDLSPAVEAACKEAPKGRACWEGHDDLYLWSEGQPPAQAVRLVTMLPDGEPVAGALAGSTRNVVSEDQGRRAVPINVADYRHAVSSSGSRVFFEAEGNLYARENGSRPQSKIAAGSSAVDGEQCVEVEMACTIEIDAAQGGAGSGGGKWLDASEDGARVFFADERDLTATATAAPGKPDLYEYDFEAPQDERLKDITEATTEAADVLGLSGAGEDGSYVYFVAKGRLTVGQGTSGAPNLYVRHDGATTFIATLSAKDECDWASDAGCYPDTAGDPKESGLTSRVAGNGRYLAFNSVNQITPYLNTDSITKEADEEIYLYEAEAGRLACVSCKPSGAAPSAGGAALDWPTTVDRTGNVLRNAYPQRNVSETGQVFFETSEVLLPQQDTNGLRDVYEYEHGVMHLISGGTSTAPSYFLGASASGSDVFFSTAQKLLEGDTDSAYDIYDARVDGGFPEPPASSPPCMSEAGCRGPASTAPTFSAPASATFAGIGNLEQTTTFSGPSPMQTARQKRQAELRSALQQCARLHRRIGRRRRQCEQRARLRFSQEAKAARRGHRRGGRHRRGGGH